MSSIASVFNMPVDPKQLQMWSFYHAAHHRDINRAILKQFNKIADEFALDPMPPPDPVSMQRWLYQHQIMHGEMDGVLGIQGNDLTGLVWDNEEVVAGWIQQHAGEHLQAANILGIG